MEILKAYENRLRHLTEEVQEKAILGIVSDKQEIATNLNTDQLFSGERSDGSKLPDYSSASVNIFGKPPGPIRLFDSGDFYKGFFIHTDKFPLFFDSSDPKTTMLVEGVQYGNFKKGGYGESIFGLNQKNTEDFANQIKPEIIKYYQPFLSIR